MFFTYEIQERFIAIDVRNNVFCIINIVFTITYRIAKLLLINILLALQLHLIFPPNFSKLDPSNCGNFQIRL